MVFAPRLVCEDVITLLSLIVLVRLCLTVEFDNDTNGNL